jgi:hypothetical protein
MTINSSIGLEKLKLVHLNDSKGGFGSGLDRHEHIGLGAIGEEGLGFKTVLCHERSEICHSFYRLLLFKKRRSRGPEGSQGSGISSITSERLV